MFEKIWYAITYKAASDSRGADQIFIFTEHARPTTKIIKYPYNNKEGVPFSLFHTRSHNGRKAARQ